MELKSSKYLLIHWSHDQIQVFYHWRSFLGTAIQIKIWFDPFSSHYALEYITIESEFIFLYQSMTSNYNYVTLVFRGKPAQKGCF